MEAEGEMQKALLSWKWEISSLIEEASGGGAGRPHVTTESLCLLWHRHWRATGEPMGHPSACLTVGRG